MASILVESLWSETLYEAGMNYSEIGRLMGHSGTTAARRTYGARTFLSDIRQGGVNTSKRDGTRLIMKRILNGRYAWPELATIFKSKLDRAVVRMCAEVYVEKVGEDLAKELRGAMF